MMAISQVFFDVGGVLGPEGGMPAARRAVERFGLDPVGAQEASWLAEEFLLLTDDDAVDDCGIQDDPADAGEVN